MNGSEERSCDEEGGRMMDVTCSLCGGRLTPMGSVGQDVVRSGGLVRGGNLLFDEQWYGTCCSACRHIYCNRCQTAGPGACPRCGAPLKPATTAYLPLDPVLPEKRRAAQEEPAVEQAHGQPSANPLTRRLSPGVGCLLYAAVIGGFLLIMFGVLHFAK